MTYSVFSQINTVAMRILMLLDRQFPPDIRVENEALSLIRAGHEVHILSYNFSDLPEKELYKQIHVHRFRIPEQVAKKSLGLIHALPYFKYRWKKEALRVLKSETFDAIHIHDLPLCILAASLKGKAGRITADMHENYPYLVQDNAYMNTFVGKLLFSRKIWFRKEKEWLLKADDIVCVAEQMKERLDKVLEHKKPIRVVPNTFNLEFFTHGREEMPELNERFRDRFVVSYIGGFDASRGIHILIRAIAQLRNDIPDLQLVLVGDGSNRAELEQLTSELDIASTVHFEGWQPSSKVIAYIEASSVCVIPHLRSVQTDNSSPNKLFQYMYFAKPVVASDCKSIEQLIRENDCGLTYPDQSPEALAEKLLFLYQQYSERLRLGANGKTAVETRYNWETTVKPLLDLYNQ